MHINIYCFSAHGYRWETVERSSQSAGDIITALHSAQASAYKPAVAEYQLIRSHNQDSHINTNINKFYAKTYRQIWEYCAAADGRAGAGWAGARARGRRRFSRPTLLARHDVDDGVFD